MFDQQQRNHKASLRYTNSLQTEMSVTGALKKRKETGKIRKAEMPSTGENYFENWRTDCTWYAQLQIPPPS